MFIKSLHIKAFGVLHDETFEFHQGFNQKVLQNEAGKTTMVEALCSGLCGYPANTKKTKFLYYPYLENDASLTLELLLSEDEPPLTLIAEKSAKSANYYYLKDGKKTKIDKKKELLEFIKIHFEERGLAFNEKVTKDELFFDAENIMKHESMKAQSENCNVSYIQAIDFRGKSINELISSREEKKKKLYTPGSNSVSEYSRLKTEKNLIDDSLKELREKKRGLSEDYNRYQEESARKKQLEGEISSLEFDLSCLKSEIEKQELIEDYRNSKRREKDRNFKALDEMPSTSDYELKKQKIEQIENTISELEIKRANLKFGEEESRILKLRIAEEEGLGISSVCSKMCRLKELESKKTDLGNRLVGFDLISVEWDVEKAEKEAASYETMLSEYEDLGEREMGTPKLIFVFMMVSALLMAYFYKENTLLSVLSLVLAFASLISWLVFFVLKTMEDRAREAKAHMLKSKISEGLGEIKKIPQLKTLISGLKTLDEMSYRLMKDIFQTYTAYQNLGKEIENLRVEIRDILSADDACAALLTADLEFGLKLAELYLSKSDFVWEKHRELLQTEKNKKDKESEKKEALEKLRMIEDYYRSQFHTVDVEEIEELKKEKIKTEAAEEELRRKAEKLKFDLDVSLKEPEADLEQLRNAYNDKSSELDDKRSDLAKLTESLIALGAKVSEKPVLSIAKYNHYTVRELEECRVSILEKLREVKDSYNRLLLEVAVLKEMDIILKERMKPQFVQKASEYFSRIAPECSLRLDMNSDKQLIFIEEKNKIEFPFSNLSSGTKSQFVFCLKLAYLDEVDKECNYPLIIDDAFMTYDGKRYERAIELLKEIAQKRQVFYFETA